MDAYKILCLVGEGSFGRVFKAKRRDTKEVVALKIIRKCGRTQKELLSLRSECEIQKHLHHHNIIQMINSFETESEIVVVTEFCKRDLHYILAKQSYLSEEVALPIVCDLVSALFYLHSNRVLHRDLKPQNVLITEDGVAKLCDFGFARSMSRGTHVLTSIKGTPLYMAPELIEESPYDHNADLWSLGCIVYEMVVGMPPFTTSSILQLVRMIRSEPVVWPPYLSDCCRSLLQGLLHKDPVHRLSWPTLLQHPFLQDRVSSSIASGVSLPLTKELTSSQALAKETQKQDLATKIDNQNQTGLPEKIQQILDSEKKVLREGGCQTEVALDLDTLHRKLSQLQSPTAAAAPCNSQPQLTEIQSSDTDSESVASSTDDDSARAVTPLETEEWLAFLQQSIREVMRGDVESVSERSFVAMVTAALSRHGAAPKVTEYVASLLALPFITPGVTQSELKAITDVYEEVKVVSSLLYAVRLVCPSESSQLSVEQLLAVERVLVLACQLVHCRPVFLSQLCDVVCLLKLTPLLHSLLSLHRSQSRIALDLISILSHVLRECPENSSLVQKTLLPDGGSVVDWHRVVKHGSRTLQTRVCLLLQLCACHCVPTLQALWSPALSDYIHTLAYDSNQALRCTAEDTIEIIQELPFYDETCKSSDASSVEGT